MQIPRYFTKTISTALLSFAGGTGTSMVCHVDHTENHNSEYMQYKQIIFKFCPPTENTTWTPILQQRALLTLRPPHNRTLRGL